MEKKEPLEALQEIARDIGSLVWGPQIPQARRDLYARVLTLIRDYWKPQRKEGWKENKYRDELVGFLYKTKRTPSVHISTKQGFGDIIILENERCVVALELKLDLKGMGMIRILRDQMEEDIDKCDGVIAVLLGKTSPEDFDKVEQKARKLEESRRKTVKIIRKDF